MQSLVCVCGGVLPKSSRGPSVARSRGQWRRRGWQSWGYDTSLTGSVTFQGHDPSQNLSFLIYATEEEEVDACSPFLVHMSILSLFYWILTLQGIEKGGDKIEQRELAAGEQGFLWGQGF